MAIQLPATDKEYYLLICEECIYAKAKEMNIPATYISKHEVEDDCFSISGNNKNYVCIFFDSSEDRDIGNTNIHGGYKEWITMCNTYEYELGDSIIVHSPEEAAKYLPRIIEDIERVLVDCGRILTTDYEGRCGNCHSVLDDNDKYCRICGTKRGEGSFLPYFNETYYVYGPPIKIQIQCGKCGYTWKTIVFGGDDSKYCPQCGKKKLKTMNREELNFVEFLESDNQE